MENIKFENLWANEIFLYHSKGRWYSAMDYIVIKKISNKEILIIGFIESMEKPEILDLECFIIMNLEGEAINYIQSGIFKLDKDSQDKYEKYLLNSRKARISTTFSPKIEKIENRS